MINYYRKDSRISTFLICGVLSQLPIVCKIWGCCWILQGYQGCMHILDFSLQEAGWSTPSFITSFCSSSYLGWCSRRSFGPFFLPFGGKSEFSYSWCLCRSFLAFSLAWFFHWLVGGLVVWLWMAVSAASWSSIFQIFWFSAGASMLICGTLNLCGYQEGFSLAHGSLLLPPLSILRLTNCWWSCSATYVISGHDEL